MKTFIEKLEEIKHTGHIFNGKFICSPKCEHKSHMKKKKVIKAKIIIIGKVIEKIPQYWTFDCENGASAFTLCKDGTVLYGGYTVKELTEISKKKKISYKRNTKVSSRGRKNEVNNI